MFSMPAFRVAVELAQLEQPLGERRSPGRFALGEIGGPRFDDSAARQELERRGVRRLLGLDEHRAAPGKIAERRPSKHGVLPQRIKPWLRRRSFLPGQPAIAIAYREQIKYIWFSPCVARPCPGWNNEGAGSFRPRCAFL